MDILVPIYWVVFGCLMFAAVLYAVGTAIDWRSSRSKYPSRDQKVETAKNAKHFRDALVYLVSVPVWPLVLPYLFFKVFFVGGRRWYQQWKIDYNGGQS